MPHLANAPHSKGMPSDLIAISNWHTQCLKKALNACSKRHRGQCIIKGYHMDGMVKCTTHIVWNLNGKFTMAPVQKEKSNPLT